MKKMFLATKLPALPGHTASRSQGILGQATKPEQRGTQRGTLGAGAVGLPVTVPIANSEEPPFPLSSVSDPDHQKCQEVPLTSQT